MVLDHFSECDIIPEDNKLYDAWRYPLIGLLLKEHPDIDYSDVSCNHIEDEHSGVNMYIFELSNGKKYAYTMQGDRVVQYNDENGNEVFKVDVDEKCTFSLICKKGGAITYAFKSRDAFELEEFMKKVDLRLEYYSSEKEDVEYLIESGEDEDGKLAEKLNAINKRITDRREKNSKEL